MTPDIQPGSDNAGNLTTASSQTDFDQLSTQLTAAYGAGDQGAISQILAQIEYLAGAASGGVEAPLPPPDTETAAPRNPNVYEALFEAPIRGMSRAAHRVSANEFLANLLRNDSQLREMLNQELGGNVLQHMESGRNLLNPPGTVWHHPFDNPNVMQLLRTSEHTAPPLQPVLHPGGVGGFGSFYGP